MTAESDSIEQDNSSSAKERKIIHIIHTHTHDIVTESAVKTNRYNNT